MRKWFTFDTGDGAWLDPERFAPIFLDAKRRDFFFAEGKEGGAFHVDGLDGTENLEPEVRRTSARLIVIMHSKYGAILYYSHWNGRTRTKISRSSKGDLRLLGQYVRSVYDTPLDIGLFVPFDQAWNAVKEFMENDGDLPRSIEWLSGSEVPQIPDTMFFAGA